jgi:predicted O-methyltransferase YrrM
MTLRAGFIKWLFGWLEGHSKTFREILFLRGATGPKSAMKRVRRYSDQVCLFANVQNWPESLDRFSDMVFLLHSGADNFGILNMRLDEAAWLFERVASMGSCRIAEIGRYKGGSTFLMAAASGAGSVIDSYDIHKISVPGPGRSDPPITGPQLDDQLRDALRRYGLEDKANLLVRDSLDADPAPETYDLVLIDGDHSYEAAKRDFLHWKDACKPGAHLLFHDAAKPDPKAAYSKDLVRLTEEIRSDYADSMVWQQTVGTFVHFRRTGS